MTPTLGLFTLVAIVALSGVELRIACADGDADERSGGRLGAG